MRSTLFIVASLALLAACVCAQGNPDVIQHIPAKVEATPLVIAKDGAVSGASEGAAGAIDHSKARRAIDEQESDLLPSPGDADASPFGENSQVIGRGRIKVLPAFLG